MMKLTDRPQGEAGQVPLDIKYVGSLSGCYSLPDMPTSDGDGGETSAAAVFACRVQSITTRSAVLSGPVATQIGGRVLTKIDSFPVMASKLTRLFNGGFAVDFVLDDDERAKLAGKIDWIKKKHTRATRDMRHHKRIMPPNPRSAITLADGTIEECFIIDVSREGVGISSKTVPAIGARLAVGRAVGQVVRHFESGFAMKLDHLIELDDLDPIFQWSLNYLQNEEGLMTPEEAALAEMAEDGN